MRVRIVKRAFAAGTVGFLNPIVLDVILIEKAERGLT
jgi:hypothetical protein